MPAPVNAPMTVPDDHREAASITRRSRRALLAGALGGIGAFAAAAIGRANPVRAEGETMEVGGVYNTAESATILTNNANSNLVFKAESAASGIGVHGKSASQIGVYGQSTSYLGVYGTSMSPDWPAILARSAGDSTALMGHSASAGAIPTRPQKTGVFGYAIQDGSSRGVFGRSKAGQGVRGQATSGVGVYGKATSGFALRTAGRAKFSTSGVATIAKGNVSVLVDPGVNVTSGSFVLLTPKANIGSRGLWFTTNASADTFTIRMSSSRSSNTKVAWLLLG